MLTKTLQKHKTDGRDDGQHAESTAYDGQRDGCDGSDRLYFPLLRDLYTRTHKCVYVHTLRVIRRFERGGAT